MYIYIQILLINNHSNYFEDLLFLLISKRKCFTIEHKVKRLCREQTKFFAVQLIV